jgi:hypothetical protein
MPDGTLIYTLVNITNGTDIPWEYSLLNTLPFSYNLLIWLDAKEKYSVGVNDWYSKDIYATEIKTNSASAIKLNTRYITGEKIDFLNYSIKHAGISLLST